MVQLSHPYMTTGKTITLTIWTFFGKVMSLLLKMLSKFVVAFLPRSKCLLILWLQSLSAVILDPKKIKICPCIHYFSIYLLWSDGTGYHELRFFECWVLSQLVCGNLLSQPEETNTVFSSAQFSRSVVSDSLRQHGLQHSRLPCLSATPGACSHSCPLT